MKSEAKQQIWKTFRRPRHDISFQRLVDTLLPYLEAVNTPKSLAIYLCMKHAPKELLSLTINPTDYLDAHAFKHDYQALALLSKYEDLPTLIDTAKVAEYGFIQNEMACNKTNDFFIHREGLLWESPAISNVFFIAQRKIARWLGDCPLVTELPYRFGPGNNVGLTNNKTSLFDKLNVKPTLTGDLASSASDILDECPAWTDHLCSTSGPTPSVDLTVVDGSKLGFVPKNAKTDRAICTEPLLNSFVQLGIGKVLRRKLKHAGCNLDSQKRNQDLAYKASVNGKLSTVDLKAASDTISYMLVLELLPTAWFELLDSARSKAYTYEGRTYEFEKFSSMGNGFTFELESMIFLALAEAVAEHLGVSKRDISVYGDDIIIPSECYNLLEIVMAFSGFTINHEKSFSYGPFRESCGEDFFFGAPVRPIFIKKSFTNATLMATINGIWRRNRFREDPVYNALYDVLYSLLHPVFRALKGPDGFGDGHVVCWRQDACINMHHSRRKLQHDGYGFWSVSEVAIKHQSDEPATYPAALFTAGQATVTPVRFPRINQDIWEASESSTSVDGAYCFTRRRETYVSDRKSVV